MTKEEAIKEALSSVEINKTEVSDSCGYIEHMINYKNYEEAVTCCFRLAEGAMALAVSLGAVCTLRSHDCQEGE